MTGHRCVVQGCSNCADHASGISLHQSPVNRSEREKWMRFVRTRRANFNPTGRFVICSEHFSEDCFERSMHLDGSRRRILPGSVPTVRKKGLEKPLSARSRRNVLRDITRSDNASSLASQEDVEIRNESAALVVDLSQVDDDPTQTTSTEFSEVPVESQSINLESDPPADTPIPSFSEELRGSLFQETTDGMVQTCMKCEDLRKEKRKLLRQLRSAESKLNDYKQKMTSNQTEWVKTLQDINNSPMKEKFHNNSGADTSLLSGDTDGNVSELDCKMNFALIEEEATEKWDDNDPTWAPEEIDDIYNKAGDDDVDDSKKPRLKCEGKSCQEEPKGIVFLSKLLLLFQHCHLCFAPEPELNVSQTGTMLSFTSKCRSCSGTFSWNSQPFLIGKFPAGNILLSFAIICAGASVGKVLLVFTTITIKLYIFLVSLVF